MKYYLALYALFLLTLPAWAQSWCSDPALQTLPILAGGRVKPLKVHARESLHFLQGDNELSAAQATELFCSLSLSPITGASPSLSTKIEHQNTRQLLQLEGKTVDLSQLLPQQMALRGAMMKRKFNDGPKKDLQKNLNKLGLYESITSGQNWVVPNPVSGELERDWLPISQWMTQEQRALDDREIISELLSLQQRFQQRYGDDYQIEVSFERLRPFSWAMVVTLLAIFALGLFQKMKVAYTLVGLTVILQIVGITFRVLISGRAPITNMYETVMFSGFGALVLGLIMSATRREKVFVLVGLAYNFLCLMMMAFAHNMLDPAISPLVPVLRDNFWLSTHVTTIILSYAALALSWVLANMVLIKKRFFQLSKADLTYYSDLIYTALKYGVILLAAGLILGGVWADYSWGRFWGWDPKETWSLIVLCLYMAILHGRFTNWIPNSRFVPLVALAFLSVMMAWFGVNYILASGLHSYGFSEGGAIFLGTFFISQIALVLITEFTGARQSSVSKS